MNENTWVDRILRRATDYREKLLLDPQEIESYIAEYQWHKSSVNKADLAKFIAVKYTARHQRPHRRNWKWYEAIMFVGFHHNDPSETAIARAVFTSNKIVKAWQKKPEFRFWVSRCRNRHETWLGRNPELYHAYLRDDRAFYKRYYYQKGVD